MNDDETLVLLEPYSYLVRHYKEMAGGLWTCCRCEVAFDMTEEHYAEADFPLEWEITGYLAGIVDNAQGDDASEDLQIALGRLKHEREHFCCRGCG